MMYYITYCQGLQFFEIHRGSIKLFSLLVNLHRNTRTNEYAGMQMFLTTNLKRDWSA